MALMLKNVRIAFPCLDTPKPFEGGNDPTPYFNASFLFAPGSPTFKMVEAEMIRVAKEKWPKNWEAVLKGAKALGKVCMRDGDTKAEYDGYPGNFFVSSRSKVRPTLLKADRSPATGADIYAGCYVNASVELFAYEKPQKGIAAQLRGVQFFKDGDAFAAGRPASEDEFEDVSAASVQDEALEEV
jgi:hypothetical protein